MKLKSFAIFDNKIEAYMSPFFMTTKGQALRAFEDTVNDTSTQFNKHPSDFTLFEIAEYDDSTATFVNVTPPISLGTALDYIKK